MVKDPSNVAFNYDNEYQEKPMVDRTFQEYQEHDEPIMMTSIGAQILSSSPTVWNANHQNN